MKLKGILTSSFVLAVSILISVISICFIKENVYAEALSSFNMQTAELNLNEQQKGICFNAGMTDSDYQTLLNDGGNFTIGIILVPSEYIGSFGELSIENVFGDDAVYNLINSNNDINWNNTETKPLALNLSAEFIQNQNSYIISGSVFNILPQNLTKEYCGIAYIKKIEFAGYDKNRKPTPSQPRGVPNAVKAAGIEYGNANQDAQPFLQAAANDSESKSVEIMQQVYTREMKING